MLTSALAGFAASVVLIVAIGAQNAFVLRQGLRREHVLPVVVTCAVSDLALIAAGIAGLGAVVAARPAAVTVIRVVGA
ncbi:MAG: LysE family transporter, partial [Actinoplanes sp.]